MGRNKLPKGLCPEWEINCEGRVWRLRAKNMQGFSAIALREFRDAETRRFEEVCAQYANLVAWLPTSNGIIEIK